MYRGLNWEGLKAVASSVISILVGRLAGFIRCGIAAIMLFALPSAVYAALLYVDQNNPQCSDVGAGSEETPFCTIGAAATSVAAGDTVTVKAGTYAEEVVISTSGTAGAGIAFVAEDGVTVTGQATGFSLLGVSWVTVQGFTISQTTSHGIKGILCSNLTVTDNRVIDTGDRGIYVRDSSDLTISNNEVDGSIGYGIFVKTVIDTLISDNVVTHSGQPIADLTGKGIYMNDSTASSIVGNTASFNTDAGIYLTVGTHGVTVKGNVLHDNARQYMRSAAGIDLRNSTGNTIEGNISFDNEDTGIQLYPGADDNLVVNNLTYDNGDHGMDTLSATGARYIGNTVFGNYTSGINIEGGSTGATVMNNISMDNGIDSDRNQGNIRFDYLSTAGAVADYNLVYLSTPSTVYEWGSVEYESLAALRAAVPSLEPNGIEADPKFIAPELEDFHLRLNSPAIDSANSGASGALAVDLEGNVRFDEPQVVDTGIGPRIFDDRGAFEFQGVPPGNSPPEITDGPSAAPNPVASDETAQLTVVASDPDLNPLTYSWIVPEGGGSISGNGPTVTYNPPSVIAPQIYPITVNVTDGFGGLASGTVDVTVEPGSVLYISPNADSWVEQRYPDANHGSEARLWVDAHFPRVTYLRFDLTGLSATVASAILELQVTNASDNGGTIYLVTDNAWDENTLTFNNSPVIDGPALDTLGPVSWGNVVSLDVTSAITGGGVYTFAIVSDSPDGVEYRSREDSTKPPVLVLDLAASP